MLSSSNQRRSGDHQHHGDERQPVPSHHRERDERTETSGQEQRHQISHQLVHAQLEREDSVAERIEQRPHVEQALDAPGENADFSPELHAVGCRGFFDRHGLGFVDDAFALANQRQRFDEIADQIVIDLDVVGAAYRIDGAVGANQRREIALAPLHEFLVVPVRVLAFSGVLPSHHVDQLAADARDRRVREVADQFTDRIGSVHRVGIGKNENLGLRRFGDLILHRGLADSSEVTNQHPTSSEGLSDLRRPIGRSVRRDDDLDPFARVIESDRVLDLPGDARLFVVGGDHQTDRGFGILAAPVARHQRPRHRQEHGIACGHHHDHGNRKPQQQDKGEFHFDPLNSIGVAKKRRRADRKGATG